MIIVDGEHVDTFQFRNPRRDRRRRPIAGMSATFIKGRPWMDDHQRQTDTKRRTLALAAA